MTPIDDSNFHLNQMKRILNMNRKDYLTNKNFQEYVKDCDDSSLIESGTNKGEGLYLPVLNFDDPKWINHVTYKELRQLIISKNKEMIIQA